MSVALFIVTERPVEGLETFVDGKALAHCRPAGAKGRGGRQSSRHLETLAREAGARPLMEFFSISPDEARALLDFEGGTVPGINLPPEQWFSPVEGLATVRGLLAHLAAHPPGRRSIRPGWSRIFEGSSECWSRSMRPESGGI